MYDPFTQRQYVFARFDGRAASSISGLVHYWKSPSYGDGYRTVCGNDNDASNVPPRVVTCLFCLVLGR